MNPIPRHRLSTRIWHWVNAVAVVVMIMSGLMILNAHPRLYWGQAGANFDTAWLELARFPGWLTLPSNYDLALARRWHLAFAWVFSFGLLGYFVRSLWNGHFRSRLALGRKEVAPRRLWQDIKAHARFDFGGGSQRHSGYNPLQKITYSIVLFVLFPAIIASGLAMSPGMNAAWPWLIDVFGGRQSARSVHFLCMAGIAGFLVVHLLLVLASEPVRQIRAMITGGEAT